MHKEVELKKGNEGIAQECGIGSHFILKYRRIGITCLVKAYKEYF